MERYIGIDVHAASCTIAVISQSGRKLKDFPVETNGDALISAIQVIPGHKHLVFEEGTQSAWLYEILSSRVDDIAVAGVRQSRGPKSDKRDAYGLAEKLRIGALDQLIFKAPRQFTKLRELARSHMMIGRDLVRVQARIKSIYRSRGIQTPGNTVYSKSRRNEWRRQLPPAARQTTTRLYEHYDFLVEQKKQAEKELIQESAKHPIARILQTAPGLGPIRVARLVPIVVTPHRFRTRKQFCSYCGLGIVMRSSSDWAQNSEGAWVRAPVLKTRGLSRRYNHVLKDIFKGAATTVITSLHNDPLYCDYCTLLDNGTKPNLAKLTLARKIAAITLRMWKNEEEYDPCHNHA